MAPLIFRDLAAPAMAHLVNVSRTERKVSSWGGSTAHRRASRRRAHRLTVIESRPMGVASRDLRPSR
jgi:hypothetical protein